MHRSSLTIAAREPASPEATRGEALPRVATGGRPLRPRRPARAIQRADLFLDVFILLMTAGVIAASIILTPGDHAVSLFGHELPPTCTFKRLTGHDCLGCGLTRSFTYMGHLDLRDAFSRHILGPVLYVFVGAQIPYRLIQIGRRLKNWNRDWAAPER